MPRIAPLILVCLLAGVSLAAPAAAQNDTDLADQVRRTEAAFAKSMADRDHAAFASFIAEEAVFFSGESPLRGKAAVVQAWKRYYEAPQPPFAWAPEHVAVLDSGLLAFSSGPVLDLAGKRVGTFNSVWRRESDGSWKIVFDNGCPACACK